MARAPQAQVDGLIREVVQAQQPTALESQNARPTGFHGFERCGAEFWMRLTLLDQAAEAVEERGVVGKLLFH